MRETHSSRPPAVRLRMSAEKLEKPSETEQDTHKSISIHAFTFVEPEVNQLFSMHEILRMGLEQTLKDVGEVSHVEFVVEIRRRFAEIVADLRNEARLGRGLIEQAHKILRDNSHAAARCQHSRLS